MVHLRFKVDFRICLSSLLEEEICFSIGRNFNHLMSLQTLPFRWVTRLVFNNIELKIELETLRMVMVIHFLIFIFFGVLTWLALMSNYKLDHLVVLVFHMERPRGLVGGGGSLLGGTMQWRSFDLLLAHILFNRLFEWCMIHPIYDSSVYDSPFLYTWW